MHAADADHHGHAGPAAPTALGLGPERTRQLLEAAGRAPSLHNSQPWHFGLAADRIDVRADPSRQLAVADPDGRELRLSCGAALLTLRLGLQALGVSPLVTLLPVRADPDLLATVRRGGAHHPTPAELELWAAVPRRATNRRPFDDAPVNSPDRHALQLAAAAEGAHLHVVTETHQRETLARLGDAAHAEQLADPAHRAELTAWTTGAADRDDGVPAAAGGPSPHPHERWVHRDFHADADTPLREPRFESEPLVCVLSTPAGGPSSEVSAGQALQRVLLEATVRGLAVSPLSQVIEVARTRQVLRALLGPAHEPQSVLRVGHGWPSGRTPRRAIEELLVPPVS